MEISSRANKIHVTWICPVPSDTKKYNVKVYTSVTYDSIGPRWNRLLIRDKCDVVSVHAVWQPAQNKTGQHNEEGHRHAALLGEDLLPVHGRILIHPLHVFLNLLKYPYIAEQHDS